MLDMQGCCGIAVGPFRWAGPLLVCCTALMYVQQWMARPTAACSLCKHLLFWLRLGCIRENNSRAAQACQPLQETRKTQARSNSPANAHAES
jgi:hypothetical protein